MISLFTEDLRDKRLMGEMPVESRYRHLTSKLEKEVDRYSKYLRSTRTAYVKPDSTLVQILHSLDYTHIPSRLIRINEISSKVKMIYNKYGLISPYNKPKNHKGNSIYPDGVNEYYVADLEFKDILGIGDEWEELKPVTIVSHDYNSLNMSYFTDDSFVDRERCVFIRIHIELLAYMYNEWKLRALDLDENVNVLNFITEHILSTTLMDHLNISLCNRYYNLYMGHDLDDSIIDTAYYRSNNDEKVNEWLLEQIGNVKYRSMDLLTYLHKLPVLNDKHVTDILTLPRTPITRYNEWYYNLVYFRFIDMLLLITKDAKGTRNRGDLNSLHRELKVFLRRNDMRMLLDVDVANHYITKLELLSEDFK